MPPRRFKPSLQLDVDDNDTEVAGGQAASKFPGGLVKESSFKVSDNTFRRDGLELDDRGIRGGGGGSGSGSERGTPGSAGGGYGLRSSDLIPVRALGSGNGGVVRLCRHRDTGTLFAVKKSCGVLYNRSHRDQMCKEIGMMRKLDCECLVQLHEAFYRDENLEMVLEFMDLGSLDDVVKGLRAKGKRLVGSKGADPCGTFRFVDDGDPESASAVAAQQRRQPAAQPAAAAAAARVADGRSALPERCLAGIAYQILWGLAFLKYEKLMHRDIKPQNILMNSLGQVKLTDFGIARVLEQQQDMSVELAMTFAGTFKYMSPERIRNEKYSARCDLWSFGLVMVELATGRPAYPASTTHIELIEAVVHAPPPSLDVADGFSRGLGGLVANCLKKDPRERLPADILVGAPWFAEHGVQSVAEAVAAVREWLETSQPPLRTGDAEPKKGPGGGGGGGDGGREDETWVPDAKGVADKEDDDYGDDSFERYEEGEESKAPAAADRDALRLHLESTRDSPREAPQFKEQ